MACVCVADEKPDTSALNVSFLSFSDVLVKLSI